MPRDREVQGSSSCSSSERRSTVVHLYAFDELVPLPNRPHSLSNVEADCERDSIDNAAPSSRRIEPSPIESFSFGQRSGLLPELGKDPYFQQMPQRLPGFGKDPLTWQAPSHFPELSP